MQWRLNVMTIAARSILMALIVVAGANIVRNVTTALMAVAGVVSQLETGTGSHPRPATHANILSLGDRAGVRAGAGF
jgi:hypothetical protein